jgi:dipeptidyl aminopeptidase/acylaminoacyl peptidase
MLKLLVVFVGSLSCISGLVINPPQQLADKEPYSFDDIFDPTLRPRGFSPRWVPGKDQFYYRSATGNRAVFLHDAETDVVIELLSNATFNQLGTGTYYFSHDMADVLFAYEVSSVWRHSFNAKYQILHNGEPDLIKFPRGDLEDKVIQFAGWSPSSSALSFVYENNLYVQANVTSDPVQVTTDGHLTDVFNGVADWLYEEDVTSESSTHFWSPNSEYIVYARINATEVPFQSWPVYGDKSDVFGKTQEIRYPKAGHITEDGKPGPTSKVDMFVYDVAAGGPIKPLPPPTEFASEDHYFLQVAWINGTHVFIMWANRVQNHSISVFYDVTEASPSPITVLEHKVPNGWLEVVPPAPWFTDSESYITIHPREIEGSGLWRQPAIVSLTNGTVTPLIEPGMKEEVDTIYGYDKAKNVVYYSTTAGNATERLIYRVGTPDAHPDDRPKTCLTCDMGGGCRYITSSFSSSTTHYFVNCRGPEIPTYWLRRSDNSTKRLPIEENADVKALLDMKALPTRVFFKIPVDGGKYEADAELFIPPDHEEGKVYPLLLYAYAGPGSQRVMATYPIGGSTTNWLMYLKSTHKLAMVSIDGRGASGRGEDYKFLMYRNMGTVEIEDQIQAGRYLNETAIDATLKIVNATLPKAIFGWSYGGFTTAHVLGTDSDVFKCGVSVAPATTFRFYDAAYTERFLGLSTPDDDELGYNQTDVIAKVDNFKDKKYMIAHGMADDNVHFMHATHMIRALSDAGVMFRQNIYVDQDHSITTPGQSRHLYRSMTEFLLNDCWGTTTPLGAAPPNNPPPTLPTTTLPTTTTTGAASLRATCSILVALFLLRSSLTSWT